MLGRLWVAGLLAWLLTSASAGAQKDGRPSSGDWDLLPASPSAAVQIWALPNGVVFVRDQPGRLFRSDDWGDTWQVVPGPPGGRAAAVDPNDPSVLYGLDSSGLLKSTDAGLAWRLIRSNPVLLRSFQPGQLGISPADPNLLYLAEPDGCCEPGHVSRSRDGGATWETAYQISRAGSPCVVAVTILQPHPTDPRRVFTDAGCYAGRDLGRRLSASQDQGATWSTVFPSGRGLIPQRLVGGAGVDPRRLYLTTTGFMDAVRPRVYRSDDDGATWSQVLQADDPSTRNFGGLAYDPDQPERVYVATGRTSNPDDTGVRVTDDGGQTWRFLGRQDLGWINDLVRTPDGAALFAATNEGMWRLLLG